MTLRLTIFLATLATLAIIHTVANEFYLYWKYLWFDIPMHFLGGISVALGISVLPFFRIRFFERFTSPWFFVLAALSVGILWEVFEATAGIMVIDDTFVPDTALDLIMDVLGGLVGYRVVGAFRKL